MQTLISAFEDRASARRAVDRLARDGGFAREDIHLQEGQRAAVDSGDHEQNLALGDQAVHTAEREVAIDRNVLESLGHFFVSLLGADAGEKHAGHFNEAYHRGHSVVVVDARDDEEAERAAVILHESGATKVHDEHHGRTEREGVYAYRRADAPSLSDVAAQPHRREDSLLGDRAAQVTRERADERAYASDRDAADKDRPSVDPKDTGFRRSPE